MWRLASLRSGRGTPRRKGAKKRLCDRLSVVHSRLRSMRIRTGLHRAGAERSTTSSTNCWTVERRGGRVPRFRRCAPPQRRRDDQTCRPRRARLRRHLRGGHRRSRCVRRLPCRRARRIERQRGPRRRYVRHRRSSRHDRRTGAGTRMSVRRRARLNRRSSCGERNGRQRARWKLRNGPARSNTRGNGRSEMQES